MHAPLPFARSLHQPVRSPHVPRSICRRIAPLLAALGSGFVVIAPASAGTIYWNMQTLAATSATDAAGLVIGDLARGQAGSTSLLDSLQPSSGYQFLLDGLVMAASGSNNAQAASLGGALLPGSSAFFTVTLTNTSGRLFLLTGFGFGSRSTSTGPQRYAIRSSLDSFATTISGGTGSLPADNGWVYSSAVYDTPLSLPTGQPVELRVYGFDGTATQRTAGNWRIDDVRVTFVPEPSTAAGLAGMLALTLAAAGRRIRNAPGQDSFANVNPS